MVRDKKCREDKKNKEKDLSYLICSVLMFEIGIILVRGFLQDIRYSVIGVIGHWGGDYLRGSRKRVYFKEDDSLQLPIFYFGWVD